MRSTILLIASLLLARTLTLLASPIISSKNSCELLQLYLDPTASVSFSFYFSILTERNSSKQNESHSCVSKDYVYEDGLISYCAECCCSGEITISSRVNFLQSNAFSDCRIDSITLPKSLSHIESDVFGSGSNFPCNVSSTTVFVPKSMDPSVHSKTAIFHRCVVKTYSPHTTGTPVKYKDKADNPSFTILYTIYYTHYRLMLVGTLFAATRL